MGGQCGWSPAAWIPRQPKQRGLEQKMLLVLPKSHSVCHILQLVSSNPWPEEVIDVREDKGLHWIEEAYKELYFPDLGFVTFSYQQVLLPPALTLRALQPTMSHSGG